MRSSIKILTLLYLLSCSHAYGQMSDYDFKRELKGVSELWHRIVLPDDVYEKVSPNLHDIRVFGITKSNDTIEAPYLLHVADGQIPETQVAFKTLNVSHDDSGYYFTFEVPTTAPINQIKLDFKQQNFDWKVRLEGSQDQIEWFTIADDYRIVSIKNNFTDFQFTALDFAQSKFRYFRLLIKSNIQPDLIAANVIRNESTEGTFRDYPIESFGIKENTKDKQTEIDITLLSPVPISRLNIYVRDTIDYYRPVTIQYLADSFQTAKGWRYNYRTLTSGILKSLDQNEFRFSSTITERLKILIHNQDNSPLAIDTIKVQGYVHELIVRYTEEATYYLTYGKQDAQKPHYDIGRFTEKIPTSLAKLALGNEQAIEKADQQTLVPLFQNKAWLWAAMTVIILLLGWFSVKMMKS